MAPKKSLKSSTIWNFFQDLPKRDKIASCNLCKQQLSYKSTTNNLRKHLMRKHPVFETEDDLDGIHYMDLDQTINDQEDETVEDQEDEPIEDQKIIVSGIWDVFEDKPKLDKIAVCNFCNQELSYKSTSNNLKKHIQRKHPVVQIENISNPVVHLDLEQNIDNNIHEITTIVPTESDSSTSSDNYEDFAKTLIKTVQPPIKQTASNTFLRKKMAVNDRRKMMNGRKKVGVFNRKKMARERRKALSVKNKIDDSLMMLFTHDFQPFSIIEDYGFKNFVAALNPMYELPSKKTIVNKLLPADFQEVHNRIRNIMSDIKCVTLASECWTSQNLDNFLSVTAHFINNDFEIRNIMLDCAFIGDNDISNNLAVELKRIIEDWNLENKVLMIISDNTFDIKEAVEGSLKLPHFDCYAHTMDLIAEEAFHQEHTYEILAKVKFIIDFFTRNTSAMLKLNDQQRRLEKEPKKLIHDKATRWSSTYCMVERFIELETAIKITMNLLNDDLPIISADEWELLKQLLHILKPLQCVINVIGAEKYVTASPVIILTNGVSDVYSKLKQQNFDAVLSSVISSIEDGINNRLGDLESCDSLIVTTFLDPRFKNIGFSNEFVAERAKEITISLLIENIKMQQNEDSTHTSHTLEQNSINENSIWMQFDKKIATAQPTGTIQSRAVIEVQWYLEEPPISREEDPVKWWKNNFYNFPHLGELVKENFITMATSAPSERLFSKSSQILSDRRHRLSPNKLKELLFLNYNKNISITNTYNS